MSDAIKGANCRDMHNLLSRANKVMLLKLRIAKASILIVEGLAGCLQGLSCHH